MDSNEQLELLHDTQAIGKMYNTQVGEKLLAYANDAEWQGKGGRKQ